MGTEDQWQARVDAVWADEGLGDQDRIVRIDALAAERGEDDAVGLFERAGARDSAGEEAAAEELYRRALDAGLDEDRRIQATIQLASTLRNLGRPDESLALLEPERATNGPYRDAVAAFHALALASSGDPTGGLAVALEALAPHLPRYVRSVTAYAGELRTTR